MVQQGFQNANKTLRDTCKNLQDAPQDALKSLQDGSKPLIFLSFFFPRVSDVFELLVILVLSWSNMASKTPSRPSKTLPKASRRPQKPPMRPQDASQNALKTLQNALLFFLSFSDMPSLCQVLAKSLPDCQIRQRCMHKMVQHNGLFCEGRGRLPMVVWRWFARVGRLRSARPPW